MLLSLLVKTKLGGFESQICVPYAWYDQTESNCLGTNTWATHGSCKHMLPYAHFALYILYVGKCWKSICIYLFVKYVYIYIEKH